MFVVIPNGEEPIRGKIALYFLHNRVSRDIFIVNIIQSGAKHHNPNP